MKVTHDIHVHTSLSLCSGDSGQTPKIVLETYEKMGIKLIGFANHMWENKKFDKLTNFYNVQNYDYIMQIKDLLPKESSIKILVGCETEYCGGDKIGITPEVAEKLDFVLCPFSHFHMDGFVKPLCYKTNKEIAQLWIERFEGLLNFDYITVVAHPSLYFNDEVFANINIDRLKRCLEKAAKKNIGIEINAEETPMFRYKDNREGSEKNHDETHLELFRIARNMGCKFSFGSDSHTRKNNGAIKYCQIYADELNLKNDDLIDLVRGF